MRKIICYYRESSEPNMSTVHLEDAETSVCLYLTDDQKSALTFLDTGGPVAPAQGPVAPAQGPVSSTVIDELIALKKAGFSSAEIMELKQSQLI